MTENQELTLENFAAMLMWQITHSGEYHTLFLASSEEHKAERLDTCYTWRRM